MKDWTVLITADQSMAQAPISPDQSNLVLHQLGTQESWIQYPKASGRGHGFETRWWQRGADAASVAAEATKRYMQVVADAGLDVGPTLIHVASPAERLTEAVMGLERRRALDNNMNHWSVMLRAVATSDAEREFKRSHLRMLLALLEGEESSGFAREGLVEVRFWIKSSDAVAAAELGAIRVENALTKLGYHGWVIARAHVCSLLEARRTQYLGLESRIAALDLSSFPVAVTTASSWPKTDEL